VIEVTRGPPFVNALNALQPILFALFVCATPLLRTFAIPKANIIIPHTSPAPTGWFNLLSDVVGVACVGLPGKRRPSWILDERTSGESTNAVPDSTAASTNTAAITAGAPGERAVMNRF